MKIEDGVLLCAYPSDITVDGKIVVPDGVRRIGSSAFWGCYWLNSIDIPKSVTSIGGWAFCNCTSLTEVSIPDSITHIGAGAFQDCTELASVNIPNGLEDISDFAFLCCTHIKKIRIPNSIKSFGYRAFGNTCLESSKKNYKAFRVLSDGTLVCRNTPYAVGKKTSVDGNLKLCENGIHYSTNLYEVFDYYCGEYDEDFVIAECTVSDEQDYEQDNVFIHSKRCARWVIPNRILKRKEVINILNNGRNAVCR